MRYVVFYSFSFAAPFVFVFQPLSTFMNFPTFQIAHSHQLVILYSVVCIAAKKSVSGGTKPLN